MAIFFKEIKQQFFFSPSKINIKRVDGIAFHHTTIWRTATLCIRIYIDHRQWFKLTIDDNMPYLANMKWFLLYVSELSHFLTFYLLYHLPWQYYSEITELTLLPCFYLPIGQSPELLRIERRIPRVTEIILIYYLDARICACIQRKSISTLRLNVLSYLTSIVLLLDDKVHLNNGIEKL